MWAAGSASRKETTMPNRTPLYEWHVAQGARMVDFAGWEMPIQYTSIVEEHEAVRKGAGLFDISHMGRLVFEGPDALDLIQFLYTNDAASMKPGQARYGLICNEAGGILDDVLVYRLDPVWLMVVNASNREKIIDWIEKHQGNRQVRVTDKTFDWAMLAFQGPKATAMVETPSLREQTWTFAENIGRTPVKYYHAAVAGSPGASLRYILSRTGYTGENGYELIAPKEQVLQDLGAITETLQKAGVRLQPCGLGARDTLRLEAAMALYGHELNESIDPFQAGLGWAVKMDKGNFAGREALTRRQGDVSLRVRVGLELEGKRIAREGSSVLRDGASIGTVTSGTFSPTLGKAIAMAYIDPKQKAAGTVCEVDVRGKPSPARVVAMPFYRKPKA